MEPTEQDVKSIRHHFARGRSLAQLAIIYRHLTRAQIEAICDVAERAAAIVATPPVSPELAKGFATGGIVAPAPAGIDSGPELVMPIAAPIRVDVPPAPPGFGPNRKPSVDVTDTRTESYEGDPVRRPDGRETVTNVRRIDPPAEQPVTHRLRSLTDLPPPQPRRAKPVVPTPAQVAQKVPGGRPKSETGCLEILGNIGKGPWRHCGEPRVMGSKYCVDHEARRKH